MRIDRTGGHRQTRTMELGKIDSQMKSCDGVTESTDQLDGLSIRAVKWAVWHMRQNPYESRHSFAAVTK